MIYAAGEVLLVMIGILLAIQVNKWKEDRKREAVEIEFLKGFINDLEMDLAAYERVIPEIASIKSSINIVLDHLEKDLPWRDSLKYHFGKTFQVYNLLFSLGTYGSIISNDWSIISNINLKMALIGYYRKVNYTEK
ncbi:MAG: hypothetical protein HRU40_09665 [Saprospiraceae bacterium]|nr:hypothetical protein [Saprospiraceae bacterium]